MKSIATAIIILLLGGIAMAGNLNTSSTYMLGWLGGENIHSVSLEDGKLIVVRTRDHSMRYPEGGGPPQYAYRDIYVAKDGVIVLEKTETGNYYPESSQRVPERFEWK